MQHFLNLDKCNCGAYRYLAIREHKKSYEVYLIHHSHSRSSNDSRKYMKLASIPKYKLNIHDSRVSELSQKKVISMTTEQLAVLRSFLRDLDTEESILLREEERDEEQEKEQLEHLEISEQVLA